MTDKNYKHVTTGQPCNAAQYIAETVCLREAESFNEGRPGYKLWNTKKWQSKFKSQVTKAYQLLKKYTDKAIIGALKSDRGRSIYSLRVKSLEGLIVQEQKRIDNQPKKDGKYEDNTDKRPMKPYGKKGLTQKIRGLDG